MIDEVETQPLPAADGDTSAVLAEPSLAEPRPPLSAESAPERDGAGRVGAASQVETGPVRRLTLEVEHLAWSTVVLLAILVRLPALNALPLALADSSRAFSAWQVAAGRLPVVWSGSLVETLTTLFFKLFGAGDGMARLASALLGMGLVAAFWLWRPLLGRASALIAALAIAVSPVCVAVSRSLSPYSAGALFAVVGAALLLSFIQTPRAAPVAWLAGVAGLGFSTDAAFLVFLLTAVLFCVIEGVWQRRPEFEAGIRFLRADTSLLVSASLIGAAGLLVATTRFGIATDRLRSAAAMSWSLVFSPPAAGPPWHFWLDALLAYEPLLFLGGLATLILAGRRIRQGKATLTDRFLLYWGVAAFIFVVIAPRKEMGELPMLLVPLALAAGLECARWLASARWELLRSSVVPVLLAFPPLVYVLFELEGTTLSAALSLGQEFALVFLFIGGVGLLILGAIWSREAAPAFATLCGLTLLVVFGLRGLARVGFQAGDEFLLGPVATVNASALANEIAETAPTLDGPVSIDPQLSAPLAWYTRGDIAVHFEAPSAGSAGVVQSVKQVSPPSFQPFLENSEIARAWYPASADPGGILRWWLYRQAWEPVGGSTVSFLVKSEQP